MPPSTIITPRWNRDEVYSAIPTQDPEAVGAEKIRVVDELHKLGHIRAVVEVKDLWASEVFLTDEQLLEVNNNTFFHEISAGGM